MTHASSSSALKAYAAIGVETGVASASPSGLVLMLYEGAIAAVCSAQQHMRQNRIAAKGELISKAISIIDDGLKASLDLNVGGELAQNLADLYTYLSRRLLHANSKNDADALEEVRQLLQQLKGAWETLAASHAAEDPRAPQPQLRRTANSYGSV